MPFPAVRAGLAVPVVIVGAESTGTTTVAREIAKRYRARGGNWMATRCVEEYGRDYTAIKWQRQRAAAATSGRPEPPLSTLRWDASDFDAVAMEQGFSDSRV
jgi:HTH-type transcriptional repressor of NAD biosynthesis genes